MEAEKIKNEDFKNAIDQLWYACAEIEAKAGKDKMALSFVESARAFCKRMEKEYPRTLQVTYSPMNWGACPWLCSRNDRLSDSSLPAAAMPLLVSVFADQQFLREGVPSSSATLRWRPWFYLQPYVAEPDTIVFKEHLDILYERQVETAIPLLNKLRGILAEIFMKQKYSHRDLLGVFRRVEPQLMKAADLTSILQVGGITNILNCCAMTCFVNGDISSPDALILRQALKDLRETGCFQYKE